MPTDHRRARAFDQLNSMDWVRYRYLNGPDPDLVLEAKEATVRRMLTDGTFRGFGQLFRMPVFAGESQIWRTTRGEHHPNQDTG